MLRCMKHERPEKRTVFVGNKPCPTLGEAVFVPEKHIDNRVISSKYTILTFLPKNLFEQLRRIANFYFLVVGIIQLLIDTPVTPITSILPLVFVISVTAIKQGYEDWLRHKADSDVNNRKAAVVEGNQLRDCQSKYIKVGDIVRVQINEEFPCDLIMLSSSDPEGKCYITTANLDGETNLKTRVCVNETRTFQLDSDFERLEAIIECEQPAADLFKFVGRITTLRNAQSVVVPLSLENILLRGSRLKNTNYVYGCSIYTGQETKMALNSRFKKSKFSRIERRMNTFLLLFLAVLFVLCSVFTGLKYWYTSTFTQLHYIPPGNDTANAKNVVEDFLSFMVIFNYIIPISLYVTVEMQKFIGSMFFGWDLEMYDERTNDPAKANTSDLNEELGQIEYLFTDKTGTLTENNMRFRLCSIDGDIYEDIDGRLCQLHPQLPASHVTVMSEKLEDFFTVLAVCHTVRVDNNSGGDNAVDTVYSRTGEDYDYHASSPDEKALVEACRRYGIVYHGIRDRIIEVTFWDTMRRWKILHLLEFDSERRCMSIIVQNEKDEIYLLTKGAEVSIFDKIVSGDKQTAKLHVDRFAVLGLRTLAIAHRQLTAEEFHQIDALLLKAKTSLQNRDEELSRAYLAVERELKLLGVTAVEDKLQEQVPETIISLRHAGIKVWVLTGDKEETAVNISHSAGHFNSSMRELRLVESEDSTVCETIITAHTRTITLAEGEDFALIVDGYSLTYALTDHRVIFSNLCHKCVAVLCCRMSPIQKAQVVRLVKQSDGHPVTAAIGDGANDVSMIQEADVGLGIMGKEGRQAVQCSDYAFGKFRFLSQALLFHGHLYYVRLSTLVQYFFYKNIALITPQVFFQIFAAISQQTVYDPFYLLVYNITCTSLPILIYGILEQHMQRQSLLSKPHLYKRISHNANMSWRKFIEWSALGLWHGTVSFFGAFLLSSPNVSLQESGKMIGLISWGTIIILAVIMIVNFKTVFFTYYWAWPMFLAYAISAAGNLGMSFFFTALIWPRWATSNNNFFNVLVEVMSCLSIWLALIIILIVALIPDALIRIYHDIRNHRHVYKPTSDIQGGQVVLSETVLSSQMVSPSCSYSSLYGSQQVLL